MLQLFLVQLKQRKPIITLLLVLACLISTVPQFFLPDLYDTISGQVPAIRHFYLIPLSSFTHSPEILINHFIGNILVFLLFGSITELLIGSSRFAFISVLTFISTTLINIWHSTDGVAGHGASGICWGYFVFFAFFVIIFYETKGKFIFKDIFLITLLVLMSFYLWGIPLLEVVVLGHNFFENFGQVLHLISMIVVVPFVLLWRKSIEHRVLQILNGEEIYQKNVLKNLPSLLLVGILLINVYGTIETVRFTNKYSAPLISHINPPKGTSVTDMPERIIINFKYPVLIHSEKLITTSINYETQEPPSFRTAWIDEQTMEIRFSRRFQEKENLMLGYLMTINTKEGIQFKDVTRIEYK
ncbi:Membrane associated serine protease, rhomboid family [Paenibacillus sophorae]|uniref:Membrane associated serine protease, rhomboid family n=1 Tax=Paenibacillus sophorae TaxID=1333845 RepID=A0A1H8LI13_9BACL|nr:rhomboid family intramembrane serine protease [Paenibacillus sophorae]QWU17290.1 rhomboid family intramembrane serine protease [Paenibacillus sophorae]SEO04418.1 Membrane associated serine protease, rhomboid family [Paenibacillus sophorae]